MLLLNPPAYLCDFFNTHAWLRQLTIRAQLARELVCRTTRSAN
jgi:hypothetical protein